MDLGDYPPHHCADRRLAETSVQARINCLAMGSNEKFTRCSAAGEQNMCPERSGSRSELCMFCGCIAVSYTGGASAPLCVIRPEKPSPLITAPPP